MKISKLLNKKIIGNFTFYEVGAMGEYTITKENKHLFSKEEKDRLKLIGRDWS